MAGSVPSGAVPFVDDKGKTVTNLYGRPMLRPIDRPPSFFTSRGNQDKIVGRVSGALGEMGALADDAYEVAQLSQFRQNGPWDVQRIKGVEHPEFIDYASVAIGLYCASAGILFAAIMLLQNQYAARRSHFPRSVPMDGTYKHLPERNVFNTRLGYTLYDSGRIK
ncbi:hypothetical protein [Acidocella sp.]|uniref:hypothetical protein n=1 Tax=Acidocella sp. TaxID=50710 RepID=UPI003CFDEA3C